MCFPRSDYPKEKKCLEDQIFFWRQHCRRLLSFESSRVPPPPWVSLFLSACGETGILLIKSSDKKCACEYTVGAWKLFWCSCYDSQTRLCPLAETVSRRAVGFLANSFAGSKRWKSHICPHFLGLVITLRGRACVVTWLCTSPTLLRSDTMPGLWRGLSAVFNSAPRDPSLPRLILFGTVRWSAVSVSLLWLLLEDIHRQQYNSLFDYSWMWTIHCLPIRFPSIRQAAQSSLHYFEHSQNFRLIAAHIPCALGSYGRPRKI